MLSLFAELNGLVNRNVRRITGSGAPTDGTSGTGVGDCGPGSEYTDYVSGLRYVNLGTKASPVWSGSQSQNAAERVIRTRFSIAQINAGATLLAALTGLKYQVLDLTMIAIGGAAGTSTTVDVLATQAAGSVKLLAVAIAALAQSAVVRAGAANASVLANGASFVANDVSTAITVGKTGGTLDTATSIDVICRYIITT